MRRIPAVAVIGLLGAAITLVPARAALADGTTSTQPGADIPSTTVPPTLVPSTSTRPAATDPATVSPASPAVPTADAHAATDHIVRVSTSCTYFCFAPAQLTIAAGETVTWSNRSGSEHTVKRCDPAGCGGGSGGTGTDANFGSATIALRAGGTFNYTFDQPGTYVYYCTIHGYSLMHGTITVTAAPVTEPTTTTTGVRGPASSPPGFATGPRLASTGGRTDGTLAVAVTALVLGLAGASAGLRRNRA